MPKFKNKDYEIGKKISKDKDGIVFALNPDGNEFCDKEGAKKALKEWCLKKDKKEGKEHENEFCKELKSVGWLFGK